MEAFMDGQRRYSILTDTGGRGKSTLTLQSMLYRQAFALSNTYISEDLLETNDLRPLVSTVKKYVQVKRLTQPPYQRGAHFENLACTWDYKKTYAPASTYSFSSEQPISTYLHISTKLARFASQLYEEANLLDGQLVAYDVSVRESSSVLLTTSEFYDTLDAVSKISKILTERSFERRNGQDYLSTVVLLALMLLLAILRFAGKPFGSRSKGRLIVSLGSSADPSENTQNEVRTNRLHTYLPYQNSRRFRSFGPSSRMLFLTAIQSGI